MDFWKLKWTDSDAIHHLIELIEESHPKTKPFVLVPASGGVGIQLRLKPKREAPASTFGFSVTKFRPNLVAYLFPRPSLLGIGFMGCDALVKHLSMPFGNRNLLRLCGDAVPEQLKVIDLVFNG
jgi:hypothetical protein